MSSLVGRDVGDDEIRHYEGLVFKTASLIDAHVELDFDDIRQHLRMKVWHALRAFDASMRMTRDAYVFMCVMNQKKDLLKRVKRGDLFIEDVAPADADDRPARRSLRDRFDERYLSTCVDEVEGALERRELELPTTLTSVERRIITHLIEGYMQTEAAALVGLTKGQMESTMRRIRAKVALWRSPQSTHDAASSAVPCARSVA